MKVVGLQDSISHLSLYWQSDIIIFINPNLLIYESTSIEDSMHFVHAVAKHCLYASSDN